MDSASPGKKEKEKALCLMVDAFVHSLCSMRFVSISKVLENF